MFWILNILTSQSFASFSSPPPIQNAYLKYVGLIIKHGHISPLTRYTDKSLNGVWTCDSDDSESPRMHSSLDNGFRRRYQRVMIPRFMRYPPNCENGDLTTKGMKKISELGELYREYLIQNRTLLPQSLDIEKFTVRTNHYDRAKRTAASFMNKFYPPETPDVEQILFHSGSSSHDVLNSGTSTCSEASESYKQFTESDEFKKRKQESLEILRSMKNQTSISSDSLVAKFGDWVMSFLDNGGVLPITASEGEIKRTQDDTAYNLFSFANYSNYVSASPILRLMFKDIDDAFAKDKKFTLYVVDSQQIATMAGLVGNPEIKNIDFGSQLMMEIWRTQDLDDIVRFVYNGKVLTLRGFDKETVPKDFQRANAVNSLASF